MRRRHTTRGLTIKTAEDLLQVAAAEDAQNNRRWRIVKEQQWNPKWYDDRTQPRHVIVGWHLEETGHYDTWSTPPRITLDMAFAEQICGWWRQNDEGRYVGGIKMSSMLKKWDTDHGTQFMAQFDEAVKAEQQKQEDANQTRWLREFIDHCEGFHGSMIDGKDVFPKDIYNELDLAMRKAWQHVITVAEHLDVRIESRIKAQMNVRQKD